MYLLKTIRKRVNSVVHNPKCCETDEAADCFKLAASVLHNHELIAVLGCVEFPEKEVAYHQVCRRADSRKTEREDYQESPGTDYAATRTKHYESFNKIKDSIQYNINDRKESVSLTKGS